VETKVIKLDAGNIDAAKISEAAGIIDAGGLVAFPTETVYGIACRVKRDSLRKLDELKGRSADKYYTLHISSKEQVEKYVPAIGLRAGKLIRNVWPGPVTIVFEMSTGDLEKQRKKLDREVFENLYRDDSIGIRCPDNPIASGLLEATSNPIVAPSANLAGEQPAVDAGQVLERFNGLIDLVLDGGKCKYGKSSTVVRIDKNGLEILRQGAFPQSQLLESAMVKFLFVCTGNSCRSPMAEGMFKKYLAEKLSCTLDRLEEKGYKVSSAGTMGLAGLAASPEATRACAIRGIDIGRHRSAALSPNLLEESDLIFVLARVHRDAVIEISPQAAEKCLLLAQEKDIADPIGQTQQVYDKCAELIEQAIKKRIGGLVL